MQEVFGALMMVDVEVLPLHTHVGWSGKQGREMTINFNATRAQHGIGSAADGLGTGGGLPRSPEAA